MSKSIKFIVFISVAALLFLISCRKDLLFDKLENVSISEKFFAHSGKTEKIILSVIDEIRNRNNKKEFVSNFAIKNGLPIWNKPIISYPAAKSNFSNSFSQSNIEETDATDTFVYVPIVLEYGDKVNGFILAKINNGVELLYSLAKDYKAFSFENGVDLNDASKFVVMNLLLNKEVFGVSNYKITDYNLFTGDNETDKANSLSIEGRLAASECAIISWQSQYCGTPYYTLCRSECDNCLTYCYPISSSVEICTAPNTVTWPAGGIGISAGGGLGSGESGGGGDIPHYYPCISTPQSLLPGDPLPPCPEPGPGNGWIPQLSNSLNPCDTLAKYSQGNDFQLMFEDLKTRIPTRSENLYIFNNPLIPSSSSNPINLTTGYPDEFSVYPQNENQFVHSWGWMHNHFADADSSSLIFSAGDLNTLADQVIRDSSIFQVDYTHFMIGMVGDSNTQYILIVEDLNKFGSWASSLFYNEEIIKSAFSGAGLSQKYLPLSVSETEKRFLYVIKNTGLKLFRGSNNSQTWTPIGLNKNGNIITINCQ